MFLLFKNIWYYKVFKIFMFTTNNTIDLDYFKLFEIYWKYFNIILSFFSYFLGQNELVSSNKLLPFNIKSINPVQKYLHITELYACILKIFVVVFLLPIDFFSFLFLRKVGWGGGCGGWERNLFNSDIIEVCCTVGCLHIESYPISSYQFILIKIYYICLILYFR